jgi:hypothetical protein
MNYIQRALVIATLIPTAMGEAFAKEPLVLTPSSSWNLNYANESCQLARTFGVGDQKTLLQFEQFGPSNGFTLLISGNILKFQENFKANPNRILHPTAQQYQKTLFQFLPLGRPMKLHGAPGTDVKSRLPALVVNLNLGGTTGSPKPEKSDGEDTPVLTSAADILAAKQEQAKLENSVNSLRVEQPMNRPLEFALGPVGPAFAALHACTDDLMKSWGLPLDEEHLMVVAPRPVGDPGSWFMDDRMGAKQWVTRENSIIYFRLIVDEKGVPESCVVQDATQTDEFKDFTCKSVMAKARFKPATNAKGMPVRGMYRNILRFVTSRNPLGMIGSD